MKVINFDNENNFVTESADFILNKASLCVAEKGIFTLVLTGGSTPPKIYRMLTESPYREIFPWDKTYFFLGDERILPNNNPESNIYMINQTLFSNVDIPEKNIILPNKDLKIPEKIAKDYEAKIKDFFKDKEPCFDLLLLGMGMDCHTASLFPTDNIWKDNERLVLPTSRPIGIPEVYRISIGLKLINQSKNILMLISGNDKKEIANELLKNITLSKISLKSPIPEIKNIGEFIWHIN